MLFFRTVPPANTLVRWVNENAFVLEVQTRPCPTLGRPVHLGFPHRLQPGTSPPALRIPPHGGHPALRSTASGGFRSVLAVSSFRLRARLDVSIPSPSPASEATNPASWIWRPSFERQRDFNLPEQRAAQRTLPVCRPPVRKRGRRASTSARVIHSCGRLPELLSGFVDGYRPQPFGRSHASIGRALRNSSTQIVERHGALLIEAGRLLKLGIAVEVVPYPKLRARLLQKCVDCYSSRACLLWIELEGRHTIQDVLFWIVIEIA